MRIHKFFRYRVFLFLIALLSASWLFAQGGATTGRLTGTVKDPQGAIVPGAQVTIKNAATGATFEAITNEEGSWVIPALQNGTYTVTVSLQGFKTAVVEKVKLDAGTTATVPVDLEVGGINEVVTVTGGATVLQTESANIVSTIVGRQITELPFTTRDALQLVLTLPGIQTPGTPRTSSVSGLPKAALNISIDGASAQDNYLKSSDGFFTSIQAKSDAVEEVTVSTATPGSESAAGGAVQIRFVTRQGSNEFHGGAFWQHRNDFLNANWYINTLNRVPRDRMRLNQLGGRIGGPITIPGLLSGKDRAFFFVNYEEFRLPQTYSVTGTASVDSARQGIFTYKDSSGNIRQVNLYQLAGSKGYPSTPDPQIAKGLALISDAVKGANLTSRVTTQNDYNRLDLVFQEPGRNLRRFPTARLDFQLTKSHHLEFVHNYQHYFSLPDGVNGIYSMYPGLGTHVGAPQVYGGSIYRNASSFVMAERWTISSRIVNEVRLTASGNGMAIFRREYSPGQYALFNGYTVNNPFSSGFFRYTSTSRRRTPTKTLEENLNWLKGTHAVNFGFSFTQVGSYVNWADRAIVPSVTLGLATNDPINTGATSIFTTANFPGANTTQLGDARNLYALLTGRISSTAKTAALDENSRDFKFTSFTERDRQREFGFFAQDSWKIKPNFTLNYGLRWEVSLSPVNSNRVYTRTGAEGVFGVSGYYNWFQPGVYKGALTQFRLLNEGEAAFDTHYKDFAPTMGFAWTPNLSRSFLRYIFGSAGQTVLRGGYSIAYIREGFNSFDAMFASNDGPTVALGTNPTNYPTEFGPPGSRLLRDGNYPFLSLPAAKFPITSRQDASLNDFSPDLKPGYVQSWTFGIQRELAKNLGLELRYVANHGTRMWRQYEISETNIFENGFLNEFKIAQENLRIARVSNPSSNNFGNQGLPGQKDIPIVATGFGFTNDYNTALYISRGEAGRVANNIAATKTRMDSLCKANLVKCVTLQDPNDASKTWTLSNFFVPNPQSPGGSYLMDNGADSNYHSLQVDLNRRMAQGLLVQGGYVFSKSLGNAYANSSSAYSAPTTFRNVGNDKGPAPRDMRHAVKFNWIQELPIGPGRRFLSGGPTFIKKVLEGWQWSGVARIQSGTPTRIDSGRLTYSNKEGGVVLRNITRDQLQDVVQIRKTTDPVSGKGVIYWLPQSIIDNTLAAFETGGKSAADLKPDQPYIGPPTTPAQLGSRIFLYGPRTSRFDLALMKRTWINEEINFELRVQFLNAFNQSSITIQDPGTNANTGSISSTFGQTRNAYRDFTVSGTNDPGGRLIEFQLRINF